MDDTPAFAAAIVSLIEQPAAAAQRGQRAHAHVQTVFRWDDHVAAYETRFRQVASRGGD